MSRRFCWHPPGWSRQLVVCRSVAPAILRHQEETDRWCLRHHAWEHHSAACVHPPPRKSVNGSRVCSASACYAVIATGTMPPKGSGADCLARLAEALDAATAGGHRQGSVSVQHSGCGAHRACMAAHGAWAHACASTCDACTLWLDVAVCVYHARCALARKSRMVIHSPACTSHPCITTWEGAA
jgi:hypothetical protein